MHSIYETEMEKIQSLNLRHVVNVILSICNKYNMDINLRDIIRLVDVTIKLNNNILDNLPLILTDRMTSLKNVGSDVIYFLMLFSVSLS